MRQASLPNRPLFCTSCRSRPNATITVTVTLGDGSLWGEGERWYRGESPADNDWYVILRQRWRNGQPFGDPMILVFGSGNVGKSKIYSIDGAAVEEGDIGQVQSWSSMSQFGYPAFGWASNVASLNSVY